MWVLEAGMPRNEGGPAACQRERAGSRVWKQLEDRGVGRCATTTERQGAANPWKRGIVEKELVKKDYRTVLEASWDKVKRCYRHEDVLAQNISISENCD